MSCSNKASPLGLSWGDVTVSADRKAIARGIEFGIGNPPQYVALVPSLADTNTWLFNAADCASAADSSCIGSKGGVFNQTASHTFLQTAQAAWNGTVQDGEFDYGSWLFFNDELTYGDDGSSFGFPFALHSTTTSQYTHSRQEVVLILLQALTAISAILVSLPTRPL